MTGTATRVDGQDLERRVKGVYRDVAQRPQDMYHFEMGRALAERLGYPAELLDRVPLAAVESFAGVGYYLDLANPAPGERVLDLGSGSGMDSFALALLVGPGGQVTGVDMTEEQLAKADGLRAAMDAMAARVSFVRGYIQDPPVPDGSVELVVSNGVVNLAPDKAAVFAAAARALVSGGRLALADIVSEKPLTEVITCNAELWASCIGGATQVDAYLGAIEDAGLRVSEVRDNTGYRFLSDSAQAATRTFGIKSISLLAMKSG